MINGWYEIPGFDGRYAVNEELQVMNAETGKLLRPSTNHCGSKQVVLTYAPGLRETRTVKSWLSIAKHGIPARRGRPPRYLVFAA